MHILWDIRISFFSPFPRISDSLQIFSADPEVSLMLPCLCISEAKVYKVSNFEILKGALYSYVSKYRRESCTAARSSHHPSVVPPSWFLPPKFQNSTVTFVHVNTGTRHIFLSESLRF